MLHPMNAVTEAYLLNCFRAVLASGDLLPPRPPASIRWDDFLSASRRHGLLHHFHDVLNGNAPDHVTTAAAERKIHAETLDHKALYTVQMAGGALASEAIPYAVLKGPALARTAYSGRAPRTYGDVDMLVHRRDRDRALHAIEPRWFAQRAGRLSKSFVRRIHFHALLWPCYDGCLPLELHWSLVDRANLYRIDEDGVFDRINVLDDGAISLPVLSAEDEFLYLCIHAAKHGALNRVALEQQAPAEWFCDVDSGNRLRWFMDIQRLLESTERSMDWDTVRRRADTWNTTADVIASLRVLHRLLPGSRADEALTRMGWNKPDGDAATNRRRRANGLSRFLLARGMKMHKGVAVRPIRLWTAIRILFPTRAELRRYHRADSAWRLPLLYLTHPFHMMRKQFS